MMILLVLTWNIEEDEEWDDSGVWGAKARTTKPPSTRVFASSLAIIRNPGAGQPKFRMKLIEKGH